MTDCADCGAEFSPDWRFCPQCGKRVSPAISEASVPHPAAGDREVLSRVGSPALAKRDSSWRDQGPSEKLIALCRRFGLEIPVNATCGMLTAALDARYAARAGTRSRYSRELAEYQKLRFTQTRQGQTRQEAEREQYREWLSQRRPLVDRFLEVADRKASSLDDYGDEKWDALPKEIETCLLKLARSEDDNGATAGRLKEDFKKGNDFAVPEKYQWLRVQLESEFRVYHEQRACKGDAPEVSKLSGEEFETYLAGLLKKKGFENIRGTPPSGDQGADLLATKDNRTLVIQAKRYRGSVGNKAVQEATAAVKFYGADEGWVITSGTFTASAKALAQANNIKLVDGYALSHGFLI